MKELRHSVDFCVVGGGLAGMCAAIAAARRGIKTALVHDRPVLGGNASSEIRMWICGAHGENNRETGLVEEIQLENAYRNPGGNYSIWDSVLYEKARFQPNLELFLNCTCHDLQMEGNRIKAVHGWQLTTETRHIVQAACFADCSGDSILAPLSGAAFRIGREARDEFGEDIEPATADRKTMGMSCLIQARDTGKPCRFTPPQWACRFETEDDLPHRTHNIHNPLNNFWWLEIGGENDSIHDTESLRDELLKIAFGVWDHIKNQGDHGADNWELDWVGFLPGKRESRRYEGDHILTQNDVRAGGRFDDMAAYGGWSMDDHHPAGFRHPGKPTTFHPAPSPYGIPYRCLYSRNINNLWFAGRNISATHAATSSTRVMATCAILGQAVGTAAAIAVTEATDPRGIYKRHIPTLQQALMDDDAYLPWHTRRIPALTQEAVLSASQGDPEPLRNGIDRPFDGRENAWQGVAGDTVEYLFNRPQKIRRIRLVLDSDLNRLNTKRMMPAGYPIAEPLHVPPTMIRAFRIEIRDAGGAWKTTAHVTNNYQRLVYMDVAATTDAVRLVPETTWGNDTARVFGFEVT